MTHPLDLQSDGGRQRPILPIAIFWGSLLVVALLVRILHGSWWHFAIGIAVVTLVRVVTKWETL